MTLRAAVVSLTAACLLWFPAFASQPHGLAGMLIMNTNPDVSGPVCFFASFEAYLYFNPRQLDPADTVTLDMAIIPFQSGQTWVTLDDANGGTFAGIAFSDGLVNGLPYDRFGWNSFTVQLHPATQDYMITVNGVQAGPFSYDSFCQDQGGCFSVQALRIDENEAPGGSVAWFDTLSIVRDSVAGQQRFADLSFDTCSELGPQVVGGALVPSAPPQRVRFKRR